MQKSICQGVVIIISLLFFLNKSNAQNEGVAYQEFFTTQVTLLGNPPKIKGFLKEVEEDSLKIISDLTQMASFQTVAIHDIHEIYFQSTKSNKRKGALVGMLCGLGLTYAINFSQINDDSIGAQVFGFYSLVTITPTAALIGALNSVAKVTIPINGRTNFEREKLMKYRVVF